MIKGYLDTCVVSGLAKGDLTAPEINALSQIVLAHKHHTIELVTSKVTSDEISRIPAKYRLPHSTIYNLLEDIPVAQTHVTNHGLCLMGAGGGTREDKLLTELKKILRDEGDANHVFQAAKNSVSYLITVDRRSFLEHSDSIKKLCEVRLVSPSAFINIVLK